MTTTLKSRRKGKMAAAEARLRRMQDTIAPYARAVTPQGKPPRSEWVPGECTTVRRGEQHPPSEQDPHNLMLMD